MGRPRKRQPTDGATQDPTVPTTSHTNINDDQPQEAMNGQDDTAFITSDNISMEIDPVSFVDPHPSFLDFLGPDFLSDQPFEANHAACLEQQKQQAGIWNFDINFDPHYPPPLENNLDPSITPHIPPSLTMSSTPNLSPQGTSPPEYLHPATINPTVATAPPMSQNAACPCLASLYLALSSISPLPNDIVTAMQAARGACRTAHDTIQCAICSPPLSKAMEAPITTFQNTMILGALLPSIADAYERILEMVDAEASRAIMTQTQLQFSLCRYGGIWGNTGECHNVGRFNNQMMDPRQWRLTVRALLKVDVYGFQRPQGDMEFLQVGLKDLVVQMDEKSRARHAEVDRLIEAGLRPPTAGRTPIKHTAESEPPCRKVISMAREAVARIVIA